MSESFSEYLSYLEEQASIYERDLAEIAYMSTIAQEAIDKEAIFNKAKEIAKTILKFMTDSFEWLNNQIQNKLMQLKEVIPNIVKTVTGGKLDLSKLKKWSIKVPSLDSIRRRMDFCEQAVRKVVDKGKELANVEQKQLIGSTEDMKNDTDDMSSDTSEPKGNIPPPIENNMTADGITVEYLIELAKSSSKLFEHMHTCHENSKKYKAITSRFTSLFKGAAKAPFIAMTKVSKPIFRAYAKLNLGCHKVIFNSLIGIIKLLVKILMKVAKLSLKIPKLIGNITGLDLTMKRKY